MPLDYEFHISLQKMFKILAMGMNTWTGSHIPPSENEIRRLFRNKG